MKNSINSLCFKSIVGLKKNEPLGACGEGWCASTPVAPPSLRACCLLLVCFSPTILAVRTRALGGGGGRRGEGRGRGVAVHIKIENTNYAMEGASGL